MDTIALLHGMGSGPEQLAGTARALEVSGHRTHLADLRGPSLSAMVDEVTRLVADETRVSVVGVSMGAAVAVAFALAHPDRVSAVVLVAPAVGPEGLHDVAAEYVAGQAEELERGGFAGLREAARRSAAGRDLDWQLGVIDGWERRFSDPAALIALWRGFPGGRAFEQWDALAAVDAPTTVVAWPDDGLHPLHLAGRTASHLGAPLLEIARPGPAGLDARTLAPIIDDAVR